jgi:precorrin isomerase
MLYFCLKKRVRSDRMVKTPKKADQNARKTEKQPPMKAAGTQHEIERRSFRHDNRAERLSSRAVFACANAELAVRMRQHAEQADAVAAAL